MGNSLQTSFGLRQTAAAVPDGGFPDKKGRSEGSGAFFGTVYRS